MDNNKFDRNVNIAFVIGFVGIFVLSLSSAVLFGAKHQYAVALISGIVIYNIKGENAKIKKGK